MRQLRLRGRREHIDRGEGDLSIVLDVAHNPDAAMKLHEFLATLRKVEKTVAVFAVMADKDCHDMVSRLRNDVDVWCLPKGIGGERGQAPEKLADYLGESSRVFETFDESLECALRHLDKGGRLLIFGSFFTVAEGMAALKTKGVSGRVVGDV